MTPEERAAQAEAELAAVRKSNARTTTICTIVGMLAGAPGFWQIITPKPERAPEVTRIEYEAHGTKLDRIEAKVDSKLEADATIHATLTTDVDHMKKWIDDHTPKNQARIPR